MTEQENAFPQPRKIELIVDPHNPLTPRFTPRQIQVLEGLANGKPRKEVAQKLGISPRTVNTHIDGIRAILIGSKPEIFDRVYQVTGRRPIAHYNWIISLVVDGVLIPKPKN